MTAPDLHVVIVPQLDRRLGRQCVHDPRSRGFAMPGKVDRSTWRTKSIRLYDPLPSPNQHVGCCTGADKAMNANAAGVRELGSSGRRDYADALDAYRWASRNDPWQGAWEPDDTGSSGLAACKAGQVLWGMGEYRWIFNGADGVVQAIVGGDTVGCGTWWTDGMFEQDARGRIEPTGQRVGGHQWRARGYDARTDEVIGRCWWGKFRDFRIRREHLNDLLMDDGDAHVQEAA